MTDLWVEASYDADAERRTRALEIAKAASQGTWEFLALAQSSEEYGDRVALASDRITAVAVQSGVSVEELMEVFDRRFALLREAADNPFTKDDDEDSGQDDSDSDDDSDDGDDDSSDDSDDDGDDDDSDSDDGGDDDDDSSDEDDDSDDDSDSDDDKDSAPPWASKFSALAQRIQSGENPLEWGGTPFGASSVRKEAADGAQVSDANVPTPEAPSADPVMPSPVPGMNGGIAESTKPRQMPEGDGMDPTMAPGDRMDGIGAPPVDPALNGGDIQQGADDLPPAEASRVAAIARHVKQYNPTLSEDRCRKVARQVYQQYLHKHAEDMSPLLFGDRGSTPDGPATDKVKTWSPPDIKPVNQVPPGEEDPGGPGDGGPGGGGSGGDPGLLPHLMRSAPGLMRAPGAGAGAAAGEAAVAGEAAAAARMLPLLAL